MTMNKLGCGWGVGVVEVAEEAKLRVESKFVKSHFVCHTHCTMQHNTKFSLPNYWSYLTATLVLRT